MRPSSADDARYDRRDLVAPADLDARMRRSWQHVASQIEPHERTPRSRLRSAMALGGAFALAALGVVVFLPSLGRTPKPMTANTAMATPVSTPTGAAPTLAEGTPAPTAEREPAELSMEPQAEVAVLAKSATHTRYRLARGQATFEAPAHSGRSVVVELEGGMELRMVGSRVTVLSHGRVQPRIEVFVEAGSATIESRDGSRRLTRGDRWLFDGRSATQPLRRKQRARGETETTASVDADVATRSLLDVATSARRSGRFLEAEDAYEKMMREQPDDPRIPLAAFELARLRMDHLGDLRGAIAPLRRALASGGTSATQEDALARLVRVFDRLNDLGACRAEQARYLQRFAQGIHLVEMEQRCKGKP